MLLVLVCGVGQMKADPIDIYLCSNLYGGSWNKNATDLADFKFHFDGVNDNSENTYSLTISSSQIVYDANNAWFRIWPSGWGNAISPYSDSGSYTFAFANGQNETYDVNLGGSFYNQDISLDFLISF